MSTERMFTTALLTAALVLLPMFVYACGPHVACLGEGGEFARNAVGAEWCEIDGDGRLTGADQSLSWY